MAKPLYEQIYNFIIEEIRSGRLKHGDRIPSENELAHQFSVSRITTKKALTELSKSGMIIRIRGKGSFVADVNPLTISHHYDDVLLSTPMYLGKDVDNSHSNSRYKSGLVGLVLAGFSDSYGSELVHSIEQHVSKNGMHLVLKETQGSIDMELQAIESVFKLGVDGLIVFPTHGEHYNSELLRLVLDGFPLVLIDRYLKGINACAVYSDNTSAAKMLTDHLLSLGHRRIAFVSPPSENTSTIEDRLQGFLQAFYSRGLSVPTQGIFTDVRSAMPQHSGPTTLERDKERIRAFIEKNKDITAFVASEFYIAELIRQTMMSMGRQIPQDCSLVCFDATHESLFPPMFTHIQQNQKEMGRLSVELLIKQIKNEQVPSKTIVDFAFIDCSTVSQCGH